MDWNPGRGGLLGGGGGGTNEGGGGAGELIFIDNAIFEEKEYVIKVGRGGAGRRGPRREWRYGPHDEKMLFTCLQVFNQEFWGWSG